MARFHLDNHATMPADLRALTTIVTDDEAARVRTGLSFSSALGETRYSVVLPADYDAPARRHRRYPVVYLLHSMGGREDEWLRGGRIAAHARGREVILVCADAGRRCYVDFADGTSLCETMVARDLVAYLDGAYRTLPEPRGRGLLGISMGG